jgi:hypothetical protein
MSKENPNVLYIGADEADGARLTMAAPHTWSIHLPTKLMQALGMYIWYVPDVTVIDMCAPYAVDVYQHLRTVDADPIILLTDDLFPADARVYTLPRSGSHAALIAMIRRLTTTTRTRLAG